MTNLRPSFTTPWWPLLALIGSFWSPNLNDYFSLFVACMQKWTWHMYQSKECLNFRWECIFCMQENILNLDTTEKKFRRSLWFYLERIILLSVVQLLSWSSIVLQAILLMNLRWSCVEDKRIPYKKFLAWSIIFSAIETFNK